MSNQDSNSTSKAILGVMGLSILGQGAFIYKQSEDTKEIKEEIAISKSENEKILSELVKNKASRDSIISINSSLSSEIDSNKDRITNLAEELKKSEQKYKQLQSSYRKLEAEQYTYADAKVERSSERNKPEPYKSPFLNNDGNAAANKAAEEISRKKQELERANRELAEKIRLETIALNKKETEEKNSKLLAEKKKIEESKPEPTKDVIQTPVVEVKKPVSNGVYRGYKESDALAEKLYNLKISGLKAATFGYDENDKEVPTDVASDTKLVKVSFTLPQNFVVRASDRNYYIQILDKNNNFVGDTAVEQFGSDELKYNYKTTIKYKNKLIKVTENVYFIKGKPGNYMVKLFDRNSLIGQTTVTVE